MAEKRVTRKLAAILAADMVGYSRLMEKDEEGTIARQKAHRAELIDPKFAEHGGRIVKSTGDGLLVEFASAVDAVRCATEVQRAMAEREADVPEDRRIAYRVGINIGDIVIDGDDILGDGVNIAARIEGVAAPGGICVSGTVHEHVVGKLDLAFDDMGEQKVKNIERPVSTYRVQLDGMDKGSRTAAASRTQGRERPDKPSIAVLPFDNMSGDPEQEYFSDGISEDIITDLSKIGGLVVIARNSSFVYKGKSVDIRKVGRELGVTTVLEGSIRRAGNRVRVSAQLIDTTGGAHLWAERYDREMTDIFAVQDDVARHIVEALEVRLTAAEAERLQSYTTNSMEAHDLLLRAREMMSGSNMDATKYRDCAAFLTSAIALDPEYGAPYAALSLANTLNSQNRWAGDPAEALEEAARNAEIAKSKSPNDPFSYYAASVAAQYRRQPDIAKENVETAMKLGPNFALALNGYGISLANEGNPKAAIPFIERAIRLDPGMKWHYLHFLGLTYLLAGMYETAAAVLRERVRLAPDTDRSRAYLASALGHMGEIDQANSIWKELKSVNPRYALDGHLDTIPFQRQQDIDLIREGLSKASLPD